MSGCRDRRIHGVDLPPCLLILGVGLLKLVLYRSRLGLEEGHLQRGNLGAEREDRRASILPLLPLLPLFPLCVLCALLAIGAGAGWEEI